MPPKNSNIWRFLDVFSPRALSFLLISFLVYKHGAGQFALPAWSISIYGLTASLIPDPSSYILLLSKSRNIKRLWTKLALGLYIKIFISILVSILLALLIAPKNNYSMPFLSVFSGFIYAISETLWSSCSTYKFASGSFLFWALSGLATRIFALMLFITIDYVFDIGTSYMLICYSLLPLILALHQSGFPDICRSSLIFSLGTVKKYALWANINGFVLSFILQAPLVLVGLTSSIAKAQIGDLAYFLRAINILTQPMQVIQSILIRDYTVGFSLNSKQMVNTKYLSRLFGIAVLILGISLYYLLSSSSILLLAILPGIAVFTAFRFEFALLNASTRLRNVTIRCILPSLISFGMFTSLFLVTKQYIYIGYACSLFYLVFSFRVIQVFKSTISFKTA